MGEAKNIEVKVIPGKIANPFIKRHHYSGKVVNNSSLHFGVFYHGRLHGVMSYGPSLDKSKVMGLVDGTGWNEFLELNRMAFDEVLPRNSESRAISMSIKLIKKNAPQITNLLAGNMAGKTTWKQPVRKFLLGISCGTYTLLTSNTEEN